VDRLKILKLPTLEYRRLRGDMIQTYKLLHGLDDIDFKEFMDLNNNNRTRGHSLKLKYKAPKLDIRKHSFSVRRIVKEWTSLQEDIVSAPNLHSFKVMLDAHWADRHYVY
jgi:ribonuclease P/MRP protein subunit RPP40